MTRRATLFDPTARARRLRHRLRRRRQRAGPRARSSTLVLEALRRVKHRGAVARRRQDGRRRGLLLPDPAALLAGAARRARDGLLCADEPRASSSRRACAAEGLELAGWREVPVDPDAARRDTRGLAAADRAGAPPARPPGSTTTRPSCAPSGPASASSGRRRRVRRLALLPHGHLQGALRRRPARRLLRRPPRPSGSRCRSAIFHQRFSTNTEPSWERAQPFRFLCHNGEINAIAGQRQLDARPRGPARARATTPAPARDRRGRLRLGDARQRARAARRGGGRDVRHALAMLVPEAWEGNPRARRRRPRLLPLPRRPRRAVGRPGRASSSPTAASSAPALDRNGLRPLRYAVVRRRPRRLLAPRRAPSTCPRAAVAPRPARARARCSPSTRRGRLAGERRRSSGGSPAARPTGAGSSDGLVTSAAGEPRRAAGRGPRRRRQVAYGYTREELNVVLRPIGAHAHEPTSSMGDDTALPPLAGRARPLHSYFQQRFAQVTNPPIDHLRERLVIIAAHAARRAARRCSPRGPRRRGCSSSRASSSSRPRSTRSTLAPRSTRRSRATRGSTARLRPARPTRRRRRCAPARGMLLVPDTCGRRRARADPGAARRRRRAPPPRRDRAAHARVARRRSATSRARRTTSRCLLGYGADAICPRLALETLAALADADKLGGDRPVAGRGAAALPQGDRGRRPQDHVQDGHLRRRELPRRPDLRGDRARAARSSTRCFVGTPSPIGGVGFAELEAEARARAARRMRTKPALENPGYVKYRKGGEPHATSPAVVEPLHETRPRRTPLRKAVKARSGELYERFAELVNERPPMELRDLLELVPAGDAGPARRGRAGRVDRRGASRPARCRTARSRPRRTRRSRSPSTGSARARTPARAARTRTATAPSRNSRDQADRVGPLRRHAGVRRLRGRAADQDRAGLEAGRGRAAAGPQGHRRDRPAPAHPAGRRPDLAAAAPRHLLDRGPRPADLRPAPGQPATPTSR